MMKYHINDNGDAKECEAKKVSCPFGGEEEHFPTADEARQHYENMRASEIMVSHSVQRAPKKPRQHALTRQALDSTLEYTGEVPQWMRDHQEFSETLYGSSPRIIDTVDTPAGEAAVVWNQNSTKRGDYGIQMERGYDVSAIEYRHMESGEMLGYVKVAYATEDSFKRSFGDDDFTLYRFIADSEGASRLSSIFFENSELTETTGGYVRQQETHPLYDEDSSDEERIAAKKRLWTAGYQHLDQRPPGVDPEDLTWGMLINLQDSQAPDDEEELDNQLKPVEKKFDEERQKFMRRHRVPLVDFSRLDDSVRGNGLGTSMYVYTARMLGKQGHMLSSSSIQSDDAEGLWKRLQEDSEIPVKEITTTYERGSIREDQERFAIDFTGDE